MNLHGGWNSSFRFTPIQDNIEHFVRDFQETATQLNYGHEAIANMIESCMPIEKYDEKNNFNDERYLF